MNNPPVLLSVREVHLGLEQLLLEYLNKTSWHAPLSLTRVGGRSKFQTSRAADGDLASLIIATVIGELIEERQSDMRNAGQLFRTEQLLRDHFIDERMAHVIAEDLFASLVNTIGEHLPHVTFGSHEEFQFQLHGSDLMLWKSN
jgi:hypothetical protein